MKNKVCVVFIGTSKYAAFFDMWYDAVQKHMFKDCEKVVLAFSDLVAHETFNKPGVIKCRVPHLPWPYVTMARFGFINEALNKLGTSELATHLLFLDADLIPKKDCSFKDIFGDDSKKFVGVQHPGNAINSSWHALMTNGKSTSDVGQSYPSSPDMVYRQGCLWGGQIEAIKTMVETCAKNIDTDEQNGVTADWHDESHMNCWFINNEDQVRTLTSDYAWPDQEFWYKCLKKLGFSEPRLLHLDKPHSEFPRFKGAAKK